MYVEQKELKEKAAALQSELSKTLEATANAEKFMKVVRKYTSFEELTPTLLREFVEKIVIHESEALNGKRRGREAPQTGNRNLLFFCRQGRVARLKPDPSGNQPDREQQNFYTSLSHMSKPTSLIVDMRLHSLNPKMYHKFIPADCILYFICQFPQMNILVDSFVG
jgi:hypothetical protein